MAFLPRRERHFRSSSGAKFLYGIMGFIAGAECIDDLDHLRKDPLFHTLTDGGIASSTMRYFLGKFRLKHIEKLQRFLPKLAFQIRQKLKKDSSPIIISMDATPHEQHGKYMEGVEWDYKNRWCLSSQNAFDELGLCYGWNLMNGSAHSSTGAVEMIENIFSKIPKDRPRYFRADSAYGTHNIYNALVAHNVGFAICLKENVWDYILKQNEFKMKWKKTKTFFFDSNKCQVSSAIYAPKKLKGRSFLRVVFIRAKRKILRKEDKRHYRYYAIVTNLSEKEMSDEKVIQFYKKRANCENHIKDLKYGMDFKHFPCQKMMKNKAWGMMGIFAYNLMRFASFTIDKRGCFLKRVRQKIVFAAGEMRKGQRKIKMRVSDYIYKEVKRREEMISEMFCSLGIYRSQRRGLSPPF